MDSLWGGRKYWIGMFGQLQDNVIWKLKNRCSSSSFVDRETEKKLHLDLANESILSLNEKISCIGGRLDTGTLPQNPRPKIHPPEPSPGLCNWIGQKTIIHSSTWVRRNQPNGKSLQAWHLRCLQSFSWKPKKRDGCVLNPPGPHKASSTECPSLPFVQQVRGHWTAMRCLLTY